MRVDEAGQESVPFQTDQACIRTAVCGDVISLSDCGNCLATQSHSFNPRLRLIHRQNWAIDKYSVSGRGSLLCPRRFFPRTERRGPQRSASESSGAKEATARQACLSYGLKPQGAPDTHTQSCPVQSLVLAAPGCSPSVTRVSTVSNQIRGANRIPALLRRLSGQTSGNGMVRPCSCPLSASKLTSGASAVTKEMRICCSGVRPSQRLGPLGQHHEHKPTTRAGPAAMHNGASARSAGRCARPPCQATSPCTTSSRGRLTRPMP